MAGSVKERPASCRIDAFFAGVDAMRVRLDRDLQDPERRRARLTVVAAELLRPRDARELCRWLLTELADAVGARAGAALVRSAGGELSPWHTIGPTPAAGFGVRVEDLAASGGTALPRANEGALVVPMTGTAGTVGALWLAPQAPLDSTSIALLAAVADTAGVMLEQALLLELVS